MDIDCEHVQKNLSAYLDGEIDLSREKKIKGHLNSCKKCKLKYENLKATVESLRFYPEIEVANNFTNKVMNRINKERVNVNLSLEDVIGELLLSNKLVTFTIIFLSLLSIISVVTIVKQVPLFVIGKIFYHLFSSSYFVSDKLVKVYPEFKLYLQSALFVSFIGFIFTLQWMKQWDKSK
jgi:hypothetical protein